MDALCDVENALQVSSQTFYIQWKKMQETYMWAKMFNKYQLSSQTGCLSGMNQIENQSEEESPHCESKFRNRSCYQKP